MQNRSLYLLTNSPAHCHCTTDAPSHTSDIECFHVTSQLLTAHYSDPWTCISLNTPTIPWAMRYHNCHIYSIPLPRSYGQAQSQLICLYSPLCFVVQHTIAYYLRWLSYLLTNRQYSICMHVPVNIYLPTCSSKYWWSPSGSSGV